MSEQKRELERFEMVDRFIELANQFTKTESKEHVGAALMYAASRYNAFEASSKSKNLSADKNDAVAWYSNEYKRMLEANLNDFI